MAADVSDLRSRLEPGGFRRETLVRRSQGSWRAERHVPGDAVALQRSIRNWRVVQGPRFVRSRRTGLGKIEAWTTNDHTLLPATELALSGCDPEFQRLRRGGKQCGVERQSDHHARHRKHRSDPGTG